MAKIIQMEQNNTITNVPNHDVTKYEEWGWKVSEKQPISEPEATEPEATEPEATEPEATEPEATEPEVTEPEVTEPEVTDPDPAK